jgi:hypothetical protein
MPPARAGRRGRAGNRPSARPPRRRRPRDCWTWRAGAGGTPAADDMGAGAALEHRRHSLEPEKPPLHAGPEDVAADAAVALEHAVAGHDERHGILPQRGAHRPHRARMADALGHPRIGARLAEGNGARGAQHLGLEVGRGREIHGHREEGALAQQILVQLPAGPVHEPAPAAVSTRAWRPGRMRLMPRGVAATASRSIRSSASRPAATASLRTRRARPAAGGSGRK